ncbi:unnamed protein product, partial [Cyprideis torosa]
MSKEGGALPCTVRDLLKLPGIGPYTAAAIASIAYNVDIPVVDANVERVFSRLFDIGDDIKSKMARQRVEDIANRLLPQGQARDFNQALMDLGGLICTAKSPDCGICPVVGFCLAHRGSFVACRPVKKSSKAKIDIEMATAVLVKDGHVFIQQRLDEDVWGGLWEFPGGR